MQKYLVQKPKPQELLQWVGIKTVTIDDDNKWEFASLVDDEPFPMWATEVVEFMRSANMNEIVYQHTAQGAPRMRVVRVSVLDVNS
jgi:hypothetical protein